MSGKTSGWVMRIALVMLSALLLIGCATHYSSLHEKAVDKEGKVTLVESRIIIAEPYEIMPALLDAVHKEFQDPYVHFEDHERGNLLFSGKGFGLSGNVMVTIAFKKSSGITAGGTSVTGYCLEMSSTGSGFTPSMFPGYAIENIRKALPVAMEARGLTFTTITETRPYAELKQ